MTSPNAHFQRFPEAPASESLGRLVDGDCILDGRRALCPPQAIGLEPYWGDAEVRVIGAFQMPVRVPHVERPQMMTAAIIQTTQPETTKSGDRLGYHLVGLTLGADGQPAALPYTASMGDRGRFVLGRLTDTRDDGISVPVTADRLWGPGVQFDPSVKDCEVWMRPVWGAEGMYVRNTATHGLPMWGRMQETPAYTSGFTEQMVGMAEQVRLLEAMNRRLIEGHVPVGGADGGTLDVRSLIGGIAYIVDPEAPDTRGQQSYRREYERFYEAFEVTLDRTRRERGHYNPEEQDVLDAIQLTVEHLLDYDSDRLQQMRRQKPFPAGRMPQFVNVAQTLRDRKGICHDLALVTAWLANRAHAKGLLSGPTTVHVNRDEFDGEVHAYPRYASANKFHSGRVYVLDRAYGYFGWLENSFGWLKDYFLTGEREGYLAKFPPTVVPLPPVDRRQGQNPYDLAA